MKEGKKLKKKSKTPADKEETAPEEKKPVEKEEVKKAPKKTKAPKEEKTGSKEQPEKKEFSDAEKAKLTKEVVAVILENITKPDAPSSTFVPNGWNTKYKPALGSYKKFCQSQTGTLQVVEREHGGYVIVKAGAEPPPPAQKRPKGGKDWKNMLNGAWSAFCQAIPPGEERLVSTFMAGLPKGVREHGKAVGSPKMSPKVSPKVSPKMEPKTSPKISPKAEPAEAPVTGKKRKNLEEEGGPKKKTKKLKKKDT
jgi:hypothetical protein